MQADSYIPMPPSIVMDSTGNVVLPDLNNVPPATRFSKDCLSKLVTFCPAICLVTIL